MQLSIDVKIDPHGLAKRLDNSQKLEFIKAIDEVAADYDFTLAVLRDLSKAMENEDPEHAGKFKAIAEILDQI